MPRFDRTGPQGKGSQTGRRLGKCNSENHESTGKVPFDEDTNEGGRIFGQGLRRRLRMGGGRGAGRAT